MRQSVESRVYEGADIMDSRDVIERIAELESERDSAGEDHEDFDEDSAEELEKLTALAEEGEGSPDWAHGETLIADSYFEDYARQLAEDIGAISGDESWPCNHIDWKAAADALKQDYASITYGSAEYWIRS